MAKSRKQKQGQKNQGSQKNRKRQMKQKKSKGFAAKQKYPVFTSRLKRWIGAILIILVGVVVAFSFFEKAGKGGNLIFKVFDFLIGKTVFSLPLLLCLGGFLLLKPQKKRVFLPIFLAILLLVIGISGILATRDITEKQGGWLGYLLGPKLIFRFFEAPVALIIFSVVILIGVLIFWEFLPKKKKMREGITEGKKKLALGEATEGKEGVEGKPAFAKAAADKEKPKFEIKPIEFPLKKKTPAPKEKGTIPKPPEEPELSKEVGERYKRPPLGLFDTEEEKPASGDIDYNALSIKKTLLNFGIAVEMSEVNIGPTVTQYTLKPAEGVKLSKITALNNDLALALASHPIRIEAPIPGRSLIGIEVPNKVRAKVKTGSLIGLPGFQRSPYPLSFTLGRDVMGKPILADLDRMPHLLVAGATGAGKTICLNSLIVNLIYRNSPEILRFVLIDPKRVEFPVYGALPHLLTPVILNARKAVNALNWLVGEMERRFEVLQEFGTKNIIDYNKALQVKPKRKEEGFEIMPYIVLVIDELADLMASKGKEVEASIVRLSQLARAVGIHLVVATQRPSVEVITGLIKANITSRVAFQVASQVDSRTILDTAGADKLLGKGDMLFISSEFSRPKRIQGAFISSPEIKRIVKFIAKENASEERENIEETTERELEKGSFRRRMAGGRENEIVNFSERDPIYQEAKEVVLQYQKASASLLQRRLQIGYARAARILDMMEEDGIVGQQDGAKPRKVFIQKEEKEDDGFRDPSKITFE